MSQAPLFRSNVLSAKERLAEGREKLRQRHERGSPGVQVCRALTELFDSVVLDLFQAALAATGSGPQLGPEIALVAHGGYGRGDVAPYSDVDLMILVAPEVGQRVAPLAERLVRDLFDVGLVLGQSVRTPRQAWQLAREDAVIATSLVESRLLTGSPELFDQFFRGFRRRMHRRRRRFVSAIAAARAEERAQFGNTVFLLEPNVKRSPGGLRDMQFVRWIGFAQHGIADPDSLRLNGVLDRDDADTLRDATEFLLRLRNELHFHRRRADDLLDRGEQLRVAEAFGYRGTDGLLPVEEFMREYFRWTRGVSDVARRFLQNSRSNLLWRIVAPLLSHQFEGDFRVAPHEISANRQGLVKIARDLSETVRLAELASLYDKPIAHETIVAIRAAAPNLPGDVSPETAERFKRLLGQTARLGELLRMLHDTGVLEKIVPAFRHARHLLQFNAYHKYTVDEHCIWAVELAARMTRDRGPLGGVYRHLKRKWLLHLALLIHDLGKGFPEDHSEVGLRIAAETAERLYLGEAETETLKFLVHKHLLMSHLAFRRDTSESQVVVRFAVEVGSPESLDMLFILTAADTAAVGPGVLNAWKIEVLADLYHRAAAHLGAEDSTASHEQRLAAARAESLRLIAPSEADRGWYERQLAALSSSYLMVSPPAEIARDLQELRRLGPDEAVARARAQPETGTVEFKVGTYESVAPGIFHRLTGALSSKGLQILSAEIGTLADGLVFDRFRVRDPDFPDAPPPERLDEVCQALGDAVRSGDHKPAFRRVWQAAQELRQATLTPLPTRVRFDNATSERYTIIELFTADRMGLLYTIARTLFELELNVSVAKIGTYLDQVVDVFYVTFREGLKVDNEDHIRYVRDKLLTAIDELARQDAARGPGR